MKKTSSSNTQTYLERIRFWNQTEAHGSSSLTTNTNRPSILPISNQSPATIVGDATVDHASSTHVPPTGSEDNHHLPHDLSDSRGRLDHNDTAQDHFSTVTSIQETGKGPVLESEVASAKLKKNVAHRFCHTTKGIILSSWINVLLVFVPVGIASDAAGLNPVITFSMNAIAIIPLAGLLSHATESVARRMGDTIGALMNVTFGNAVELIIL